MCASSFRIFINCFARFTLLFHVKNALAKWQLCFMKTYLRLVDFENFMCASSFCIFLNCFARFMLLFHVKNALAKWQLCFMKTYLRLVDFENLMCASSFCGLPANNYYIPTQKLRGCCVNLYVLKRICKWLIFKMLFVLHRLQFYSYSCVIRQKLFLLRSCLSLTRAKKLLQLHNVCL